MQYITRPQASAVGSLLNFHTTLLLKSFLHHLFRISLFTQTVDWRHRCQQWKWIITKDNSNLKRLYYAFWDFRFLYCALLHFCAAKICKVKKEAWSPKGDTPTPPPPPPPKTPPPPFFCSTYLNYKKTQTHPPPPPPPHTEITYLRSLCASLCNMYIHTHTHAHTHTRTHIYYIYYVNIYFHVSIINYVHSCQSENSWSWGIWDHTTLPGVTRSNLLMFGYILHVKKLSPETEQRPDVSFCCKTGPFKIQCGEECCNNAPYEKNDVFFES